MKISNFRDYKKFSEGSKVATVDIETGILWWKKIKTVQVCLPKNELFWIFVDTGKYAPDFRIESLRRTYKIKQILAKEQS